MFVTSRSSPTSWTRSPSRSVSARPARPSRPRRGRPRGSRSGIVGPVGPEVDHLRAASACAPRARACSGHRRNSSVVAGSSAMATCSPGRVAGPLDRLEHGIDRLLVAAQARRVAALVADRGGEARARGGGAPRAWNISAAQRSPSRNVGAPIGTTMNSWKSVESIACLPPLRMFTSGTGSVRAPAPPR